MNLYKVRVYSIGYGEQLGNDTLLGRIIVKKQLFGAEELVSKWPIRIVPFNTIDKKHPDSYMRPYAYKEFGYDLAILKEDLVTKNIADEDDVVSYINNFENNRIKSIFESMNISYDTQEKVKQIRKRV